MTKFALVAVAGLLSTTAVSAADLAIAPQLNTAVYSPARAFDWSGFYAGANVGYGWGEMTGNGTALPENLKGILGGVQAGYNYDFGGFVLGLEGDIQLSDMKYVQTTPTGSTSFGIDAAGSVRARAGLPIDRFMPFVTGGLAVGNGKIRGDNGGVISEANQTFVGWTVGAGLEYAVTDNVTVKAEYLYADYGNANLAGIDVHAKSNTVRAGVNFKF